MEEEKEEKKRFKVIDKRIFAREGEGEAEQKEEKKVQEEKREDSAKTQQPPPLPEVTFSSFIYSLSTSALVHLGEIPEPTTQKMAKNLPLAKQTIDILGILQEKTKGNLTQEEENLLNSLLYDLRMRFVKATA